MKYMDDPELTECGGDMPPPYGLEYGGVVPWLARIAMQVRVLTPRMGLLLDGSWRMRFGAALGIRAGENPAIYGRAGCGTPHGGHSRVMQVRFLPRPP